MTKKEAYKIAYNKVQEVHTDLPAKQKRSLASQMAKQIRKSHKG